MLGPEAALTAALGRLQAGQFADPGRTTVGEFLEHWLDSVASRPTGAPAAGRFRLGRCATPTSCSAGP